jgi:hypothetical protein
MHKPEMKNSKEPEVKFIKKVAPAAATPNQPENATKTSQILRTDDRRPGKCVPVSG